MKAIGLTFVLFLAVATSAIAQTKIGGSPYLFPQFVSGSVLQKGGGVTEGMLDYNTLTQEMVFLQGTEKIVLELGNIDTIYIQGRKFVPAGSVCYEKLTDTKIALYEQHANELKKRVRNGNLADQSNNNMSAGQGFRSAVNQSSKYELTFTDDYVLDPRSTFWLQKGKSFVSASDLKKILKVFPNANEATVNEFIKDKQLDIKKPEDLKQLVIYCNKL